MAAAAAIGAAGCSTDDESPVPVACKATPAALERGLADAPEPVTLDGTPISECFTRASDPADIQAMGIALTEVAADLSAAARARPDSDAAVRLGYLVGAVREGASGTQGIHDELLRRVEQELAAVDTSSSAFREGERAGRESG
jgi:hypothetical protein